MTVSSLSGSGPDLLERVRRRLAESGDPLDPIQVARVLRDSSGIADDAALAALERSLGAELLGAGPLEPLLARPGVTDVLVNGADEVWIDCAGATALERTSVRFVDDEAVRRLAQRLAAATGRRLDDACPFVDAALPDGTRLHAILPPLVARPTLSLRVLARRRFDLADLAAADTVEPAVGELLRAVIAARLAFVISGGTGTGKTTLLGALLSCCPAAERIVVIEDALELVTSHPHLVRLVGRTANIEGAGAIGPAELVRQALRMRPDRVVVGEFRGAEFAELLAALNTGHDGGAATLHANTAADVPARFLALGALAGLAPASVEAQVASAFQVVIQLGRSRSGVRFVAEIATLLGSSLCTVWSPGGVGLGAATLRRLLAERGVDAPGWLR